MLLLVLVIGGCGSSGDGGTAPVGRTAHFEPAAADTTVGTLQVLRIRAFRSDDVALQAHFVVEGLVDTTLSTFDFVSAVEGDFRIQATTTVDGRSFAAEWTVRVSDGAVPPTPTIQSPFAVEGSIPGSIALEWQAPPSSQVPVPLTEYVVAYSTASFDSVGFDAVDQVVVPHDPLAIVQRTQLEGLLERVTYHIRVRVRDVLGRQSAASVEVLQQSTGHYDVTGVVYAIELGAPVPPRLATPVGPRPLGNVLVDVGGSRVLTGPSGQFQILNLPDLGPQSVTAEEQSGANFYVLQTSPLAPVSREQSIVLFPQDVVVIEPDVGVDPVISRLEYFRRLTENYAFYPYETNPWESYPIPFYLGEYVATAGADTISYRQVFLDAIDIWNEAAADSLFRPVIGDLDPVANPTAIGARFLADLTVTGGSLLGQVRVVRPRGGKLYEDVPQFLEVHMLESFLNAQIATYVAVHELGHVLGLAHSPNLQDIMFRNVRPQRAEGVWPLAEEALVAKLLKTIPPQTDLRWYASTLGTP